MDPQVSQPAASQPSAPTLRALVINLLFSMFAALVIFTVASYYFLVPQIARQDLELRKLRNQITAMNERANEAPEAAADLETAESDNPGVEPEAPATDGPTD